MTNPLSREQSNLLMREPTHQGYQVLPQRTVKIKQNKTTFTLPQVEAMDESLGRILQKLEDLGLTAINFLLDKMSGANFGRADRIVSEKELDAAFSHFNHLREGGSTKAGFER